MSFEVSVPRETGEPKGVMEPIGWGTTLWKSDTVRFVFDYLNVGNSRSQSKTIAEVTPTDVYNMRSRSVPRAYYALTHTFGCIVYIPPGGIESVRSIERAFPTA